MRKNNRHGFTLAELLIVVAIIAVLVAIAIPVFTSQLEKSREATDAANIRSAYAEVVTKYLSDQDASFTIKVKAQQRVAGWQTSPQPVIVYQGGGESAQGEKTWSAITSGSYTVGISINSSTGAAVPTID
jgi:type IV pilus assembly protein PilA